jgi:nucleoside-diphosphate kinase
LVGKVISRFEERGYKLVGLKAIAPSKELAEKHYEDLKARPFFAGLVNYMTSGTPVIAMVMRKNHKHLNSLISFLGLGR